MDGLQGLRNEIDVIDKNMIELFEKRMNVALKVAEYKKKKSLPILNKGREQEVIRKNLKYLSDESLSKPLDDFLNNLMSISRKIQAKEIFEYNTYSKEDKKSEIQYIVSNQATCEPKTEGIKVGFQGVAGSFSEQALMEYFGENISKSNLKEFEDVFKELKNNNIDYGVLPIDNSSTGAIAEVYDLLRKYGFFIVGEKIIKVNQNLMGIKGSKIEDIKEIYSHPQALQQSSDFLKVYSDIKCIPYRNTAASAEFIKKENNRVKAAIASKRAAEIYDLDIIKSNINFNKNNHTRFIIIGKNLELQEDYNKISIILSLPHKAGALYNILSVFSEYNLNMVKIESRPIIDKSFEYFFYIDLQGNLDNEIVKEAMVEIKSNSYDFKILGNYKANNID